MRQYTTFHARFEPDERHNLKPGVERWIGYEGEWRREWIVDEGFQYEGQWACVPLEEGVLRPYVWVPERDLLLLTEECGFALTT